MTYEMHPATRRLVEAIGPADFFSNAVFKWRYPHSRGDENIEPALKSMN